MTSLAAIRKCRSAARDYNRTAGEMLDNLITSDEHGMFIGRNVSAIISNREAIAEQTNSKNPNDRVIARSTENINTCIHVIKSRLERLGATSEDIANVVNSLNNADYQSVTLAVLKLMARKNPGMHQRKYEQALKMAADKQKQR